MGVLALSQRGRSRALLLQFLNAHLSTLPGRCGLKVEKPEIG